MNEPWEAFGLTTKVTVYDGESGPVQLYLHRAYREGSLLWADITIAKEGSAVGGWARCLVRQIAMAAERGDEYLRQHLEELRGQRFQPWGQTSLDHAPDCTSIPDLVAQVLLAEMP